MSNTIRLFDFQEAAANQLVEAVEAWVYAYAEDGPLTIGREEVPFVGHLKAVTGEINHGPIGFVRLRCEVLQSVGQLLARQIPPEVHGLEPG